MRYRHGGDLGVADRHGLIARERTCVRLGLALTLVFAVWLRLLPSMGMSDWRSLVLPVFTLALPLSAKAVDW